MNPSENASERPDRLTLRSVLVGLVFTAFFCAVTPYNDYKLGATPLAGTQFPVGAMFVLLVFAILINPVLRRWWPRQTFRPAELVTIWTLVLITSGLPSSGLMRYLVPSIAATTYLSNDTNDWKNRVWGQTSDWLRLSDPLAAMHFASGYPRGQEHVPWDAWARPLFAWGLLVALFLTASFCFALLLRRQWVENERFEFPLVVLPLLLAEEPERGHSLPPILRHPLLWLGVVVVTIAHSLNGAHQLYPTVPEAVLHWDLGGLLNMPPWNRVGSLPAMIYPLVVGISYLLSSEVCFSLWFFYLFYKAQLVVAGVYNLETPGPIIGLGSHLFANMQALGGAIALFVWLCYTSRQHLRDVWEKAVGGPRAASIDDSKEMLSYRAIFFGLAVSYIGIAAWLIAAGAGTLLALCFLVFLTLVFVVVSWTVCQAGMIFNQSPFGATDVLGATAGTAPFRIPSLFVLSQVESTLLYDVREFLAPSLLNGMKASGTSRTNPRSLLLAMAVAVALGTVISAIASISLPYLNGGANSLNDAWGYRMAPGRPLAFLAGAANVPIKSSPASVLNIAAGFVVVLALLISRAASGFGVHPIGLLVTSTYPMAQLWFSLLIGWAIKLLLQRYGGMKGYRAVLPFFLGLILGDVLNGMVWIGVGYFVEIGYQVMPR